MRILGGAVLFFVLLLDPAHSQIPLPRPPDSIRRTPLPPVSVKRAETKCANCHSTKDWNDFRFAHDRTGFPLRGRHERTSCSGCHPVDFKRTVPDVCSGCHRDPHAAAFGMRCEGCHTEENWRTQFTADAHRRGNFPLSGRHALIPCTECHREVRDRGFSRAATQCVECHQGDLQRAAMVSIDHNAAGFGTDCKQCHNPWRFTPAPFPAHDPCFRLTSGPHAGIRCLGCHKFIPGNMITGACNTGSAACTSCHEHVCPRTDPIHRNVAGYVCQDRKCYECHSR